MNDSTNWKKIQFVIAIMTRDYVGAMEIGRSILIKEPSNTNVREYLTVIEKIDIDGESKTCIDTDNEDNDIITVGDKDEKGSITNNLIKNYSKISSSFKIDSRSDRNDYSPLESPYKIDGKMYRGSPTKVGHRLDPFRKSSSPLRRSSPHFIRRIVLSPEARHRLCVSDLQTAWSKLLHASSVFNNKSCTKTPERAHSSYWKIWDHIAARTWVQPTEQAQWLSKLSH